MLQLQMRIESVVSSAVHAVLILLIEIIDMEILLLVIIQVKLSSCRALYHLGYLLLNMVLI